MNIDCCVSNQKLGRRSRDCMVVVNPTTCAVTVPITTKVVSLNAVHGKVCSMQHCVIKYVSNL